MSTLRITTVQVTTSHARVAARVARVEAHRAARAPQTDVAEVIAAVHARADSIDAQMRKADAGRKSDVLVSLPAALAPIPALLLPPAAAAAVTATLAGPIIVKIIRRW